MVRHEAAEALGSIASPDCLQLLTDYCKDSEPIVADSCVVSSLCLFLPETPVVVIYANTFHVFQ